MSFPAKIRLGLLLLLTFVSGLSPNLRGGPETLSYTLEVPCPKYLATPIWLQHPVAPAGAFASLQLPLTAPTTGDALLVTLYFQEKAGGFLRLTWKGAAGEQELSGNFFEGVGMRNQRSLLIPAATIAGGGMFCLQCGDTTLDVDKIHLEWLEERPVLVSPEQSDLPVIDRLGAAAPTTALDGQPNRTPSPTLDGSVVTVPILTNAQRIEEGVQFAMQLEGVPQAVRLSLEEMGLPWNQHLVLWLNQKRAGTVTPSVPNLAKLGFALPGIDEPFIGWRDASVYLPGTLFKVGVNSIQLSVENEDPALAPLDGDASPPRPLAIKKLTAQFDYTAPPSPAPDASEANPSESPLPQPAPAEPPVENLPPLRP